jgi:hypothetical protein
MARSVKRAGIFTTTFAAGALVFGVTSAPAANAVDGCAQGYYPRGGTCMLNAPGPFATSDPNNSQCWFIRDGEKRCYLGADVFK